MTRNFHIVFLDSLHEVFPYLVKINNFLFLVIAITAIVQSPVNKGVTVSSINAVTVVVIF